MQVKLRYIGIIANKLKKSEDTFELQNKLTIHDLMQQIIKTYKIEDKNPFYIKYKNTLEPSVIVMKNKKLASFNDTLSDNDTLTILPIIAGG